MAKLRKKHWLKEIEEAGVRAGIYERAGTDLVWRSVVVGGRKARWLLKAEKAPKLPKQKGGVFHPYRRLWASERQHLSDVAVAAAGGWSDTRALKQSYQKASPTDILRAVRGA